MRARRLRDVHTRFPNLDGAMASARGTDTETGKQLAAVVTGLEAVINARGDAIVASPRRRW